jgi:hypothetical protein
VSSDPTRRCSHNSTAPVWPAAPTPSLPHPCFTRVLAHLRPAGPRAVALLPKKCGGEVKLHAALNCLPHSRRSGALRLACGPGEGCTWSSSATNVAFQSGGMGGSDGRAGPGEPCPPCTHTTRGVGLRRVPGDYPRALSAQLEGRGWGLPGAWRGLTGPGRSRRCTPIRSPTGSQDQIPPMDPVAQVPATHPAPSQCMRILQNADTNPVPHQSRRYPHLPRNSTPGPPHQTGMPVKEGDN